MQYKSKIWQQKPNKALFIILHSEDTTKKKK